MKISAELTATFAALLSVFILNAIPASANETADYPKINFGGFARVRGDVPMARTSTATFSIPNARVEMKAGVADDVMYCFSMDATAGTLTLLDSFFRLSYSGLFNIRLGQFKYNFSREQSIADADLELINKSYVVSSLVSPTRDIGVEISKNFKDTLWRPFIAVGGYNGSGSNAAAANDRGTYIARLTFEPVGGLVMGGSYYDGKIGQTVVTKKRQGAEITYENRKSAVPVLFKSEYIAGEDANTQKNGYYVTAGHYVLQAQDAYILILVRQDYYDANPAVAGKEISRTTLGAVIQRDKHVSFRLNYEMKSETPSVADDLWTWQFQVKF
jgi:hypothetical protein